MSAAPIAIARLHYCQSVTDIARRPARPLPQAVLTWLDSDSLLDKIEADTKIGRYYIQESPIVCLVTTPVYKVREIPVPQPDQNLDQQTPIRPTEVKTWLTTETMSPLGRELMEIAAEIEESDEEAMDEDELERELIRRRGGYSPNGE
jgi:hypothetical protein